jgi:branched-chain amino acid aminotransferase
VSEKVFLNGQLLDADAASINVFDAGLQHGLGVFEAMRAYDGVVFQLNAHLQHLVDAARSIGVQVTLTETDFPAAIRELLDANKLDDARVRITVTAGSVRIGMHQGHQNPPTVLITAGPAQPLPDTLYSDGVGVLLSDIRLSPSDPIARIDTTSFVPRLIALQAAQRAKLAEAMWFTTDGYCAGTASSALFFINDDVIQTPSLDLPIVNSVPRATLLQIAKREQFVVEEKSFSLQQVLDAQEMFIVNPTVEVLPVVAIEKHLVGDGRVGPITRTLMQKYRTLIRQETF